MSGFNELPKFWRRSRYPIVIRCQPGRRPFPPLALLAGNFTNPAVGKANVKQDGDALVMEFSADAALKLTPRDGEVFTAAIGPLGTQNRGEGPISVRGRASSPSSRWTRR